VSLVTSVLHGKLKSAGCPPDQLPSACDCSCSAKLEKHLTECNGNSVGCRNAESMCDVKCQCDSRLHMKENSNDYAACCTAESSVTKNCLNDERISASEKDEQCCRPKSFHCSESASSIPNSTVGERDYDETKDCPSTNDNTDQQQSKALSSEESTKTSSCKEVDLKKGVANVECDASGVTENVCDNDSLNANRSLSDLLENRKSAELDISESEIEKNSVRQVLDSTETYASIIGREIAASFSLHVDSNESTDLCIEPDDCSRTSFDEESLPRLKNGYDHTLFAQNSIQTVVPHELLKIDPDVMDLSSSLDTVEVAQKVRDVLTANNVGQRQFARHVLGLSQGTISELLAKPKPWDRLSEKGRESYRRMHAWVGDQLGVVTLKTALRRKGLFLCDAITT